MIRPDWRQAWRWWSVRVSALGAILMTAAIAAPEQLLALWSMLPAELHALVPAHLSKLLPLLLFLATIVARIVPQPAPGAFRRLLGSEAGAVKAKAAGGLAAGVVAMIAAVIAVEGGWVNHPADPGGETNMGITKRVAVENGYTGPMRQLSRAVAESIYHDRYLVAPGYAPLVAIDAAVTEELFDTTVNMGPARPSRWFQASINAVCGVRLKVDGRVGAGTVGAYKACQAKIGPTVLCVAMLDRLDAAQKAEYDRLVAGNARLRVFHRGWVRHRVGNVDRLKCAGVAA